MKRALVGLVAALPLAVSPALAAGETPGSGAGSGGVRVVGTIVSVDASGGSFVANASVVSEPSKGVGSGSGHGNSGSGGDQSGSGEDQGDSGSYQDPLGDDHGDSGGYQDPLVNSRDGLGGYLNLLGSAHGLRGYLDLLGNGLGGWSGFWFGGRAADGSGARGHGPATQVTIRTDSKTKLVLNGRTSSLGALAAGDKFLAVFTGSPGDPLANVVSSAPLFVDAKAPAKRRSLYAFVGKVIGVDPTGGTVTLDVTRSFPSSLAGGASAPVSLTVDASTLILGGGSADSLSGASLSGVSVGDVLAGGLVADSALRLPQVSTLPLRILLDLPATSGGSGIHSSRFSATSKAALHRMLLMLDGKSAKKTSSHKHVTKRHTRAKHHRTSRTHQHSRAHHARR